MENRHQVAAPARGEVWAEMKKQVRLAAPLAAGFLLQKVIQTISIMFVGRLGELPLASASLATSFASVTGFSLLVCRQRGKSSD
jgi:multidrug resistance protein, MATE family